MKRFYLQCRQFQFMTACNLVRLNKRISGPLSKYFSGSDDSTPLKNCPVHLYQVGATGVCPHPVFGVRVRGWVGLGVRVRLGYRIRCWKSYRYGTVSLADKSRAIAGRTARCRCKFR